MLVQKGFLKSFLSFLMVPGALFAFSSVAPAVSIKNRDDTDHKVTIIEDGLQTDHNLKKDQVLEGVCQKGCTVRIDGDDVNPYELEGSEDTSIEGGDLYAEKLEQQPLLNNVKPAQPRPGTPP